MGEWFHVSQSEKECDQRGNQMCGLLQFFTIGSFLEPVVKIIFIVGSRQELAVICKCFNKTSEDAVEKTPISVVLILEEMITYYLIK